MLWLVTLVSYSDHRFETLQLEPDSPPGSRRATAVVCQAPPTLPSRDRQPEIDTAMWCTPARIAACWCRGPPQSLVGLVSCAGASSVAARAAAQRVREDPLSWTCITRAWLRLASAWPGPRYSGTGGPSERRGEPSGGRRAREVCTAGREQ